MQIIYLYFHRLAFSEIDLLVDRRDNVINICEIKYSDNLRNKKATFAEETKNKEDFTPDNDNHLWRKAQRILEQHTIGNNDERFILKLFFNLPNRHPSYRPFSIIDYAWQNRFVGFAEFVLWELILRNRSKFAYNRDERNFR